MRLPWVVRAALLHQKIQKVHRILSIMCKLVIAAGKRVSSGKKETLPLLCGDLRLPRRKHNHRNVILASSFQCGRNEAIHFGLIAGSFGQDSCDAFLSDFSAQSVGAKQQGIALAQFTRYEVNLDIGFIAPPTPNAWEITLREGCPGISLSVIRPAFSSS